MPKASRSRDTSLDILAVVVSRITMFAVLFWTVLAFDKESVTRGLVLIYGMSTVLYLATWASSYRSRNASPIGFLLFFQFLVEVLVEGAIFYSNEGYLSDNGLLFILTILSAGFFFRFWGALIVATVASLVFGYAGMIHLGISDPLGLSLPRLLIETVQVRFFLYTTLFFMTGLLSSLLAGRLQAARRELEGAHEAMDLYQFSAETVMNGLPNGLLFFDGDGLLKFKNGPAEEWLGKLLVSGMSMQTVLKNVLTETLLLEVENLKQEFSYRELDVETYQGKPIHVQIKTLTRESHYLGCVVLLIDFTEERQMAQSLLRSERMAALGSMSARIAHEIRNPLASISGSAQMLKEVAFQNEAERKLLGLIVTESVRLDRILSGFLEYAQDRPPTYRIVEISEMFKKILLMLEKSRGFDKDLVITRQIVENGDIRFLSDPDILVQVLLNIALNALQALPGGKGEIDFSAKSDEKNIIIKVRDNGSGMTPSEAVRAFEPFYTSKPSGTGLGLSTCLHYVQVLDGNITLDSDKTAGTEVTITLPKHQFGIGLRTNGD